MRQQAKPFTVEVKKSRKSASEPQSLFGFIQEAEAAAATTQAQATEKLFGRGAERHDNPDIASVFGGGTAVKERPATRILPDLTVRTPEPVVDDEPVRQRKPRIAKTKGPRIPAPKPLPVTLVAPTVKREEPPMPAEPVRVRRRAKDETGLARSERWKRRLPHFAR